MSLFGTSPDNAASSKTLKSGLFEDNPSSNRKQQSSGLFAEDTSAGDDSPWGFQPTPKKQARADLVKTLLPATDVPELYIDTFDALLASGERDGSGVSFAGASRLLQETGLKAQQQKALLAIVAPQSQALGRGEFNVLLALVGLAQEGEEASLDSVDDRRRRLPQPSLPKITRPRTPEPAAPPYTPPMHAMASSPSQKPQPTPANPRQDQGRKSSFGYPDVDPWATSPANTKSNGASNGMGIERTTSDFSTTAVSKPPPPPSSLPSNQTPSSSVAGDWTYESTVVSTFRSGSSMDGSGFGESVLDDGTATSRRLPKPSGSGVGRANQNVLEEVTVTAIAEKQGTLLFQYRNYEVASARKNSKVIRRYSDFVWLLDCLHKKYPFRQLPLLPPKRVAINGNHIAADVSFIEKRRRGLSRFVNALVRHPVLGQEQLVIMFLSVPTELSVWRKQASITVQEEFTGKSLPPGLEDSLPPTLDDLFETVRSGVRSSADLYISMCSLFERIVKRQEGLAGEYTRLSDTMSSVTANNSDTYKIDNNDVPLLNEGIVSTAKHIGMSVSILLDESRTLDEGALEDFKRQRDGLVSMRDMFDRRDRYAKDTIPACEKRIAANETKLGLIRAKPEGTRKVGEAEKVEEAIMKDKESIVAQHARGVFIKECIRDEIQVFQNSQYHTSRTHQDWSADRAKFAEQQADCWRELSEQLESMPLGE